MVYSPRARETSFFIATLLGLLGQWEECFVWRAYGSWPSPKSVEQSRVNDVIELRILEGLQVPLGTADILKVRSTDQVSLMTLMFSTTIFGWSVGEDLYIVPDHARQFLEISHHDVVHVTFRDPEDVDLWISGMADAGFSLPTNSPDATMLRPDWMN